MKRIKVQIQILILIACVVGFNSCKSTKSASASMVKSGTMLVFKESIVFIEETIIDKEVTIYPEAYLNTNGNGKIIFMKKVNILGETQVFDDNANIVFNRGTISTLNPCWFGAKGYDDLDDTKAVSRTFDVARHYASSINIEFPIGRFIISETLELGNDQPNGKSINFRGKSMSIDGQSGSSLIWNGNNGGTLILLSNYTTSAIENLDFNALSEHHLLFNIDMKPFINQVAIRNCTFSGCAGSGSANVNLNHGNSFQVSEIVFENCLFRSINESGNAWLTSSAVIGGLANTKNFVFRNCSFMGYADAAINLEVTDMLKVENCTFALNGTDIVCLLCNTLATSNYSEASGAFFRSTVSANVSFTTLMDNCYYGVVESDYIIPAGNGSLVLVNNNFGGYLIEDFQNKINWNSNKLSHIYSVGNYYMNIPSVSTPFPPNEIQNFINSFGDIIGSDFLNIKDVKIEKNK